MDGSQESAQLLAIHEKNHLGVNDSSIRVRNRTLSLPACFNLRAIKHQLLRLLPSPVRALLSSDTKSHSTPRQTAWLDGIRGLASLIVFIEHFSLSVRDSRSLVTAYGSPGADSLWQLPIIRLLYDASPMVPIFYVTSGCALSLKPLSHIHKDEWDNFGTTLSSATFRRAFRLFLPSAVVSFMIMCFTQLGIYSYPYPFFEGSTFIIDLPPRLDSFSAQYVDWLNWMTTQLLYSEEMFQPLSGGTRSNYGFQLWTISTEFYASLALFIALIGLARLAIPRRQIIVFLLGAFAFFLQRWDIACFLAGISITELSIHATPSEEAYGEQARLPMHIKVQNRMSWWIPSPRQYTFALLFLAGLFFASYPSKKAEENFFYGRLSALVSTARFWESIGAILVLLSVSQLRLLRTLLSSSVPGYLGRISYGVYLTHVAFLNVFGWKIVPWVWILTGKDDWWLRECGIGLGLILCLTLLLWIADLWTRGIDEPCVRLAKRVEKWATTK